MFVVVCLSEKIDNELIIAIFRKSEYYDYC